MQNLPILSEIVAYQNRHDDTCPRNTPISQASWVKEDASAPGTRVTLCPSRSKKLKHLKAQAYTSLTYFLSKPSFLHCVNFFPSFNIFQYLNKLLGDLRWKRGLSTSLQANASQELPVAFQHHICHSAVAIKEIKSTCLQRLQTVCQATWIASHKCATSATSKSLEGASPEQLQAPIVLHALYCKGSNASVHSTAPQQSKMTQMCHSKRIACVSHITKD